MAQPEGMKMKFGMFKWDDAETYLTKDQLGELQLLLAFIDSGRNNDEKPNNQTYLIINTDEPYAPEIIEIMKRHGHWG